MTNRSYRSALQGPRAGRSVVTSLAAAVLAAPLLITLAAALPGCAPNPKSVPCENDTECVHRGDGLKYCLESRCVKCASRVDCPDGSSCEGGECR